MATREMQAELFGRETSFEYSETWVGYSLLGLRLVMGWVFLQAGLEKLLDPEWTAAGYLRGAVVDANPFAPMFEAMAGAGWVDPLVVWGQLLVGLALVLGAFVRWSAFWGALMMVLFWASHLQGGLLAGLPVEHGYVVDETVVYALLLFGLGAFGAGRILGVDRYLEETEFVERYPAVRFLLG